MERQKQTWYGVAEPNEPQLEALSVDEELEFVRMTEAPEEVKSEVLERLDRFEEADAENAAGDQALSR